MGYCLTKAKLSQGVSMAKHHGLVDDNNSQINLFVWDPTEPIATRPLFMVANPGNYKLFYTFDGNKNVSELVHFESRNGIVHTTTTPPSVPLLEPFLLLPSRTTPSPLTIPFV